MKQHKTIEAPDYFEVKITDY